MKVILLLVLTFFFIQEASSRQISVTLNPDHLSHDEQTFPANEDLLITGKDGLQFGEVSLSTPLTWSLSPFAHNLAVIDLGGGFGIRLLDSSGQEVSKNSLDLFRPDDQTLALYPFDDGRVIIRDNVANFSFFSADGSLLQSVSNSSGSPNGERESELASDSMGTTLVLYNPVIRRPGGTASRAALIDEQLNRSFFFESPDHEIASLQVSEGGRFITLIARGAGTDQFFLYDRFGNELFSIDSETTLAGASVTPDGNYVTLFSSGRVQVYRTVSGELMGSASSRSSLIKANYFPEENLILALGGSVSGRTVNAPTLTAVHLGFRSISREEIPGNLAMLSVDSISIQRIGAERYAIRGLNRGVLAEISF